MNADGVWYAVQTQSLSVEAMGQTARFDDTPTVAICGSQLFEFAFLCRLAAITLHSCGLPAISLPNRSRQFLDGLVVDVSTHVPSIPEGNFSHTIGIRGTDSNKESLLHRIWKSI